MNDVTIHADPEQAFSRLEQLSLNQGILHEALRQGNLYKARTTSHHPRLYRYQVMSAETIAALRDQLIQYGWEKCNDGNYELTRNAPLGVAIAVASGDSGTGIPSRTPSNKSPKGRYTVEAVEINRQLQDDLFPELLPQQKELIDMDETWVLLHNVTETEIKAELSKPSEIDASGMIVAWSERIILGSIPLDGDFDEITPPQQPDIEISISRKES